LIPLEVISKELFQGTFLKSLDRHTGVERIRQLDKRQKANRIVANISVWVKDLTLLG
jgi:hypothetical protein